MKKETSLSDKGLEKLLRSVISEAEAKEISAYQSDADDVTFSPEYYERKNQILGEGRKREISYLRRRSLKRALLAACILALTFFALAMTSKPIREAFKNMFVNVFDEFFEVGVIPEPPVTDDGTDNTATDTEIPTYMMEYYVPSVIPEGVNKENYSRLSEKGKAVYRRDKTVICKFYQRLLSAKPSLNTEEYEISALEINGNAGELGISTDGEKLILIWDDGRYSYEINGSLDKNTAVSMAESLTRTYDWPTVLLEFYAPEYVPDGYTTTVEAKDFGGVTIYYNLNENEFITFEQLVLDEDMKIDSTDVETYGVTVNGRDATVIQHTDKPFVHLLWDDGRYSYYLAGVTAPETLIRMAESLKPF